METNRETFKCNFIDKVKSHCDKKNRIKELYSKDIDKWILKNPESKEFVNAAFFLEVENETGISLSSLKEYKNYANLKFDVSAINTHSIDVTIDDKLHNYVLGLYRGSFYQILPFGNHRIKTLRGRDLFGKIFGDSAKEADFEINEKQRTIVKYRINMIGNVKLEVTYENM